MTQRFQYPKLKTGNRVRELARSLALSRKNSRNVHKNGWETWTRTKIDGVRVRCSTIKLFPSMVGSKLENFSEEHYKVVRFNVKFFKEYASEAMILGHVNKIKQ